jgi:hypothetical protein
MITTVKQKKLDDIFASYCFYEHNHILTQSLNTFTIQLTKDFRFADDGYTIKARVSKVFQAGQGDFHRTWKRLLAKKLQKINKSNYTMIKRIKN